MTTGAWIAACLLATPPTAPGVPEGFDVLNSTHFDIPIKIVQERKADIRALELYVSTDQGKKWDQIRSATPEQASFKYDAPGDGLYWFNVVVIDRDNRREPPNLRDAPAGLKVLVDTLKPDVRLKAERENDAVVARWEVREENPDLTKFRLEWKPDDKSDNWTAVSTSPALVGQATIRSPEAIVVRLSMTDLGKNVQEQEVKAPAAPGIVPVSATVTTAAPLADPPGLPGLPKEPVDKPTAAALGGGSIRAVSTPTLPPVKPLPLGGPEEIPAPGPLPLPLPPPLPPPVTAPSIAERKTDSVGPANVVAVSPTPAVPTPMPAPAPAPVPAPAPTPALPTLPPASAAPTAPVAPPAEHAEIQPINNRRVTFEYEVSKFGPSGVGSVDLYVTRDDGMTWNKVEGEHQPAPAPGAESGPGVMRRVLSVMLPEVDGVYGFYLVVKSGAGLSKPAPRSGVGPQMRVKFDTKLPEAILFLPKQDRTAPDALVITWKATDENLTAMPVSIQWAERPTGPWEPIGSPQMANTGTFSWKVPANAPPKVFMRLTVRDTAGNVAIAETPEAISIDLSTPEVVIRGLVGTRTP